MSAAIKVERGAAVRPTRDSSVQAVAPRTASASHAIIEALVARGVDSFFGVPGGPVSPICKAVLDTAGARFIESRHETSAAFAAASFHRATGRVPAIVVTAGPGATNAVTGIANAHLGRTPMIVITGDVAWASSGRLLLQDTGPEGLHMERMVGHLCRAAVRVASPRSAATQVLAALDAATGPIPGPALCVIPMDRGRGEIEAQPAVVRATRQTTDEVPLPAVHQTAKWLAEAERPLLVLGAACRGHEASVRRLVDALGVPFVTTPQAKGVVPETHPRSLRHGGMAASLWARAYTSGGVDATLVLGTDLDDVSVGPTPYVREGGRLVHVDLDASVFHRNVPADLPVAADLGAFARALTKHATAQGLLNPRGRALAKAARSGSPFDAEDAADDTRSPIAPQRAVLDLEAAAGEDARFITDIGGHMLYALHYLTAKRPDRFHIHLRLGSMGSGIAGAIGLGLADPKRRVVCICGDGGMQMNGMELLVAADLGLPVVYAVFNDARYNMVHHGMKQLYGAGGTEWDTRWVDFAAWARSMGVPGIRVHAPGQIDAATLDRLQASGPGPVVLDIRIDREMQIRGAGRDEALQRMSLDGDAS